MGNLNKKPELAWLRDKSENGSEKLPEPAALDQEAMN
jgi:hypothetical protein